MNCMIFGCEAEATHQLVVGTGLCQKHFEEYKAKYENKGYIVKQCDHCGRWMTVVFPEKHRVLVYETGRDEHWCDECKQRDAWRCAHCKEWISGIAPVEVETGDGIQKWCGPCASTDVYRSCAKCGRPVAAGWNITMVQTATDVEAWGPMCTYTYAKRCPACGAWYDKTLASCPNEECFSRTLPEESWRWCRVLSYHGFTRGNGRYLKRGNDEPLWFGVEIETGTNNVVPWGKMARWLTGGDSPAIHAEHDGSVSGPEFISQPCTLAYHQKHFGWEELCEILTKAGFRSHDITNQEVGFHIHISRSKKLLPVIRKLDLYLHNDAHIWAKISRRSRIYHSGSWGPKEAPECIEEIMDPCNHDRYEPLNFQPEHTVELRTPRGTLKAETILGTLEWVHGCLRALENISVDELRDYIPFDQNMEMEKPFNVLGPKTATVTTTQKIIPFIWANRERYPHCVSMLTRLLEHEHMRPVQVRKELKKEQYLAEQNG